MDRVIKFRGISIETGKWVYGYFFTMENKEKYILQPCVLGFLHTEVVLNTVGQFTSLLDINGKEVYEGDLFKIGAEPQTFEVVFKHGCFMAYCNGKQFGLLGELQQCFINVIGNRFENAELLEP